MNSFSVSSTWQKLTSAFARSGAPEELRAGSSSRGWRAAQGQRKGPPDPRLRGRRPHRPATRRARCLAWTRTNESLSRASAWVATVDWPAVRNCRSGSARRSVQERRRQRPLREQVDAAPPQGRAVFLRPRHHVVLVAAGHRLGGSGGFRPGRTASRSSLPLTARMESRSASASSRSGRRAPEEAVVGIDLGPRLIVGRVLADKRHWSWIRRWSASSCQPSAIRSAASQSSNSGCVGRSP